MIIKIIICEHLEVLFILELISIIHKYKYNVITQLSQIRGRMSENLIFRNAKLIC